MVDVWVVDFVTGKAWVTLSGVKRRKAIKMLRKWRDNQSTLVVLPLGVRFRAFVG
jgi:hypothetical protein